VTERAGDASLPDLRLVCFGGDVLRRETIDRLRRAAPGAVCANFYGATETPQAMGCFCVPAAGSEEWARAKDVVPVGRGIEDVQLLVLNDTGDLVGVGELGEIHVRTPYLTLGYVDDPSLTTSRFISNPHTRLADDRIYRTGDLGRYFPDGTVEFAGRRDESRFAASGRIGRMKLLWRPPWCAAGRSSSADALRATSGGVRRSSRGAGTQR
jgi:non-ribosomal peptide synthetase component F